MARGAHSVGALTIVLLCGSGLFTSPAAQAACGQWDVGGKWALQQSNNFATTVLIKQSIKQSGSELVGKAQSRSNHIGSNPTLQGDLDGRLNGDQLTFNVYWGGDSVGVYSGTIGPTGRIEGTTHDKRNPGNRAAWYSSIRMNCLSIWGRR